MARDSPSPWLRTRLGKHTVALEADERCWDIGASPDQTLRCLALVGGPEKSKIWYGDRPTHAAICVDRVEETAVLDCELHTHTMENFRPRRDLTALFPLSEHHDFLRSRSAVLRQPKIGLAVYSAVLAPLVTTFCFFVEDFANRPAAEMTDVIVSLLSDDPRRLRGTPAPAVLLVHSTRHAGIVPSLTDLVRKGASPTSTFHGIDYSSGKGLESVRREILEKHGAVCADRESDATFFNSMQLGHLMQLSVRRFAGRSGRRDDGQDRASHILDLARRTPFASDAWRSHLRNVWALVPPTGERRQQQAMAAWIAAALLLDAFPPDAPSFPAAAVFDRFYRRVCAESLSMSGLLGSAADAVTSLVEGQFCALAGRAQTAKARYASTAKPHEWLPTPIYSNRTCLACLCRSPEKVLPCGHAVCDVCVRRWGRRRGPAHVYRLHHCPVCDKVLACDRSMISLSPPTAGMRLLTIDGGGVRGIVPLVALSVLEEAFRWADVPVHQLFDYVCGTSSGGLIALGVFVHRWRLPEAMAKFQALSQDVFRPRYSVSLLFDRAFNLVLSYLADFRYRSDSIGKAYWADGHPYALFGAHGDDVKVAVTTVAGRDQDPCLLTNYNGPSPPPTVAREGYSLFRDGDPRAEVTVSDAARCTSAAPVYFLPYRLSKSDGSEMMFQDGGISHNNPVWIVEGEYQRLRAAPCAVPDVQVSLGTGKAQRPSEVSGSWDRATLRLFHALMGSMDAEGPGRMYSNLLKNREGRLFRLNVPLPDAEPAIDDVDALPQLRAHAQEHYGAAGISRALTATLECSWYYLELSELPRPHEGQLQCHGVIRSRLPLQKDGWATHRRRLYEDGAEFVVRGRAVRCVETSPSGPGKAFARSVTFRVARLDETVHVELRLRAGAEADETRPISGFPCSVQTLCDAQQLMAPFGTDDHAVRPAGRGSSCMISQGRKRKRA